jgi:transcriptional regulator with XRE-family HTH domain
MNIRDVTLRIKQYREAKGISQEYMATQLGIAQSNYAKLERAETKLTLERLFALAKVLEVDVLQLLPQSGSHVFNIHDNPNSANGYIENFSSCQKELYEKLLAEKDRVIALLEIQLGVK